MAQYRNDIVRMSEEGGVEQLGGGESKVRDPTHDHLANEAPEFGDDVQ